jgi:hypothetical protein
MNENSRLIALWLSAALESVGYAVVAPPIQWEQDGMSAMVAINGHIVGSLEECYRQFRDSELIARLSSLLPTVHIQADEPLTPETQEALGRMIQLAYEAIEQGKLGDIQNDNS